MALRQSCVPILTNGAGWRVYNLLTEVLPSVSQAHITMPFRAFPQVRSSDHWVWRQGTGIKNRQKETQRLLEFQSEGVLCSEVQKRTMRSAMLWHVLVLILDYSVFCQLGIHTALLRSAAVLQAPLSRSTSLEASH